MDKIINSLINMILSNKEHDHFMHELRAYDLESIMIGEKLNKEDVMSLIKERIEKETECEVDVTIECSFRNFGNTIILVRKIKDKINHCEDCSNYNIGDGYEDVLKCQGCEYYNE